MLFLSEISFLFAERKGGKVRIGKRFWFGAIFLLRGWEIANLDIRGRMYALFRDKFHANGKTDARRGSSQRWNGSRGIRFQFCQRSLAWLEWNPAEIRHSKRKRLREPHSLKDLALTFAMSKKYFRHCVQNADRTRRQYEATRESDFDRDNWTNSFA